MSSNIFLIILTVVAILFIWLLWLRNNLILVLRKVEENRQILQHELDRRKDMVPFLLESYRLSDSPSDLWNKVLQERQYFHKETTMEKELEFEKLLQTFINESENIKNLSFMESKKDISDSTKLIENEKTKLHAAQEAYNEKRKSFPYSWVSGIFGFPHSS